MRTEVLKTNGCLETKNGNYNKEDGPSEKKKSIPELACWWGSHVLRRINETGKKTKANKII